MFWLQTLDRGPGAQRYEAIGRFLVPGLLPRIEGGNKHGRQLPADVPGVEAGVRPLGGVVAGGELSEGPRGVNGGVSGLEVGVDYESAVENQGGFPDALKGVPVEGLGLGGERCHGDGVRPPAAVQLSQHAALVHVDAGAPQGLLHGPPHNRVPKAGGARGQHQVHPGAPDPQAQQSLGDRLVSENKRPGSRGPTRGPTRGPRSPTRDPIRGPTRGPISPARDPIRGPTRGPRSPTRDPIRGPTRGPRSPTRDPIRGPIRGPTRGPIRGPRGPTRGPTRGPRSPTRDPIRGPTRVPTKGPRGPIRGPRSPTRDPTRGPRSPTRGPIRGPIRGSRGPTRDTIRGPTRGPRSPTRGPRGP
ncbi:unnamed protein product [Menidia menidia]|uniref:(Atlantic silverside) hypothetical protein n=1 Tax=Menidia menidia TaxID=238744 RepID=A0A8S4BR67_9TELE|nr:unnamed protein product [Menidia menidia]